MHGPSGRKATILGTLKQGLSTLKLQWVDKDADISDGALNQLSACQPETFDSSQFIGLTADIIKQVARLSGITDEVKFNILQLSCVFNNIYFPAESAHAQARRGHFPGGEHQQ